MKETVKLHIGLVSKPIKSISKGVELKYDNKIVFSCIN